MYNARMINKKRVHHTHNDSKGHFVVAIVVRVMYSLIINHSSIVHFQPYSRRKRPTLRRGLGTNNEHLAFLDIGCECGVMKYAFFLHYENLRSTQTLDLS